MNSKKNLSVLFESPQNTEPDFQLPLMKSQEKTKIKMKKTKTRGIEYPIVFQARSDEIYDAVVEYIHKVARIMDANCMEGDKVNYCLEGYDERRIRTTPSKRRIELTSTVDEEVRKSIENIIKTEIRGED